MKFNLVNKVAFLIATCGIMTGISCSAVPLVSFAKEDNDKVISKSFEDITGKPLTAEYSEVSDAPVTDVTNPGVSITDKNVGSVTVKANIDWNIHEGAFVTLTDMNTGMEYTAQLYEANGYETVINIPEGIYATGGGLNADAVGRYRMSEVYFNAMAHANTVVTVDLIDHNKELETAKEKEVLNDKVVPKETKNENVEEQTQKQDENKKDDKMSISGIISNFGGGAYDGSKEGTNNSIGISLVVTLIAAGAGLYLFDKKAKEKKKEDEDNGVNF